MFRFLLVTALVALAWSENELAKDEGMVIDPLNANQNTTVVTPATPTADSPNKEIAPSATAATTPKPIEMSGNTTKPTEASGNTTKPTEASGNTTTKSPPPSSAVTLGAFSVASLCVLSLLVAS